MIAEVVQRRGMGHSREPCALPQSHPVGALRSHQFVDRVEKRLAKLSMMIFLGQIEP